MSIPIETFFLDPDAEGTLQGRIQQMIAEGILSGRFQKNEKLPSTRRLATHLGISRITVTLAYTELLANEYLTSKGRSGYYVSPEAPEPPSLSHCLNRKKRWIGHAPSPSIIQKHPPLKNPKIGRAINFPSFMGKPIPRFLITQTGAHAR